MGGQRVPGSGCTARHAGTCRPGTPTPARALPWAEGPAGGAGTAGRAAPSHGQPAAERWRAAGAVQAVQHAETPLPPPSADPPAPMPLGTEPCQAAPVAAWHRVNPLGTMLTWYPGMSPRQQPAPVPTATASRYHGDSIALRLRLTLLPCMSCSSVARCHRGGRGRAGGLPEWGCGCEILWDREGQDGDPRAVTGDTDTSTSPRKKHHQ